MKIVALCFCLVSLSHGQTCTSQWSTFREVTEGPFYSQEAYGFNVKRTTKRKCENGRLYLRTTRSLLRLARINLFVYHRFSGFGSCSASCNSKNVTVNVVYIGNFNHNTLTYDKKIYTFQYTNKNCDKLHWTTWSETVSCQTSSHAVYARRRCVDCDGVDYPDRRYCYGSETKQIPCINLTPTRIDPSGKGNYSSGKGNIQTRHNPSKHSNKPKKCSNGSCSSSPELNPLVSFVGLVLVCLFIVGYCKRKRRQKIKMVSVSV